MLAILLVLGSPVVLLGLVGYALLSAEYRARIRGGLAAAGRTVPGRLVLLIGTAVALLFGLQMVEEVREGRGVRLGEVERELAGQWGGAQTMLGPMLVVPVHDAYQERFEKADKEGVVKEYFRPRSVVRHFVVFPEALEIDGALAPRSLHRGLYDVTVYDADLTVAARFERPEWPDEPGHTLTVRWEAAKLIVDVSDLSAVSAVSALTWQGGALRPESGAPHPSVSRSGIYGTIPSFEGDAAEVQIALALRGMDHLMVGAAGETTDVSLKGDWDAPSFAGFTLPQHREVGAGAFAATWSIPGVARPIPRILEVTPEVSAMTLLASNVVGVRLVEPASPYASVARALTYGVLVILLCLLTIFIVEQTLGLELHPVQWLVNGAALVVFYLVLLAGSEHAGFALAYAAAAIGTVGMVGAYTVIATRTIRAGLAVGASLAALYGCMFAMLRSEDYALLMGTGLVLAALACLMWTTRRLGWGTNAPETGGVELSATPHAT